MIPALLRRKLRARLARDEVAKLRGSALEFAGFVAGQDPVGDGVLVSGLGYRD